MGWMEAGATGPNRLEVRTTRCGRVNPGSIPGSDIFSPYHIFIDPTLRFAIHKLTPSTCIIKATPYLRPCNRPAPAGCRSGYTWPESTIKLNIALDHIRVVSGP